MYQNLAELQALCTEKPLWQVILEGECALSDLSEQEVFEKMEQRLQVMESSVEKALDTPLEMPLGLISGIASRQHTYAKQDNTLSGRVVNRAMAYALSCSEVNAAMGKICAAPTAGACGVLPGVLFAVAQERELTRDSLVKALITAGGVGAVIMQNATVSGAEGGCQAECGTAASMAAAAVVELVGGAPSQSLAAAAHTLIHSMGLVCDPIAGLVQVPCAQRNASQAVNALLSADLALAGLTSPVPPDEVVEAMYRVGRLLPCELRETSHGGLAVTPTGESLRQT
ncbi:MAG: L-serine ammonia-lyase, iron-sulfur-dependent, subunit alpha [Eubacteriales bacterium]